ncbi:MAG: P1 family peptidase [Vicinamibacterales bacterium]
MTAILPRGKVWEPVFAGWFAGNGFGDMTGAPWVVEGGVLGGPVMMTGTYSVGVVRDAVNSWFHEVLKREIPWHQPVVGETSDAFLNDGLGQHVTMAHVFQALNAAKSGRVQEGSVGGGTGMVAAWLQRRDWHGQPSSRDAVHGGCAGPGQLRIA